MAFVWYLVRVTAEEEEEGYPKFYGPFKQRKYADTFANSFQDAQAHAEVLPMTPPRNTPHRMDPHQRGYRQLRPEQRPPPPPEAQAAHRAAELAEGEDLL